MRRIIIILTILLIPSLCFGAVRNIQDNYTLIYNVVNSTGDHIGSQTVNLSIKKVSNSSWYDFDDDTFKASEFGNNTTALSEDSTYGYYYYNFDPPATETSTEQYVFILNNDNATYGDHQSVTVFYQDIGNAEDIWNQNISTVNTTGFAGDYLKDIETLIKIYR